MAHPSLIGVAAAETSHDLVLIYLKLSPAPLATIYQLLTNFYQPPRQLIIEGLKIEEILQFTT